LVEGDYFGGGFGVERILPTMKILGVIVAGLVMGAVVGSGAWGQKPPLLAEKEVAAIAGEISGETAKRNLEGIARFHRQRGSKGVGRRDGIFGGANQRFEPRLPERST
jgi:hypothetical protein